MVLMGMPLLPVSVPAGTSSVFGSITQSNLFILLVTMIIPYKFTIMRVSREMYGWLDGWLDGPLFTICVVLFLINWETGSTADLESLLV